MCSFTLRHWIILFLSILVVQIGTMKCFTAHKKTCLWSPGIHCPPMINFFCGTSTLMLVKGQIMTCTPPERGGVRSARPQCVLQPPFFKHLIISPPISGFWAAGAFGSSSCVWCSHVFGHRVSGSLCAFAFFRHALFAQ